MKEDIELDYNFLMSKSLRYVMRDVLTIVADLGDAPGEHHFFIEFLTHAPNVSIPDHLKEGYPERMTIVLQHQFESLTVTDVGFGVTLWFKGKEARLEIPFDAVVSFADPSAEFGLRFDARPDAENREPESKSEPDNTDKAENAPEDPPKDKEGSDGADIVSLDSFRKK